MLGQLYTQPQLAVNQLHKGATGMTTGCFRTAGAQALTGQASYRTAAGH
jgi:hypothetical protein